MGGEGGGEVEDGVGGEGAVGGREGGKDPVEVGDAGGVLVGGGEGERNVVGRIWEGEGGGEEVDGGEDGYSVWIGEEMGRVGGSHRAF